MEMGARGALVEFNRICKENNEIYHGVTRALGLTDCAFWILYTLRESEGEYTQRDLCAVLCEPKQMVNSALKKLEQEGLLELRPMSDKRSKRVHLTVRGRHLASQTVDLVLEAEYDSIGELSAKEQSNLLYLYKKYTRLLAFHMGKLTEALEEEKEKKKHED